jgi:hypothetical protein
MSGYGKIISGGARMTKGLSKGINNKVDMLETRRDKQEAIAKILSDNYTSTRENLSNPHVKQPFSAGKKNEFKKPMAYKETNSVNIDLPKKAK